MIEAMPDAEAAARSYLERNPGAYAALRSHLWMLDAATSEQLTEAKRRADKVLASVEHEIPTEWEKHNKNVRPMMGLPPISIDEFSQLVRHIFINTELLNMMAMGAPQ